jgi:hypothetical protein
MDRSNSISQLRSRLTATSWLGSIHTSNEKEWRWKMKNMK